jgi:L-ascorbate metabolism protein UlaG (beta-lactamase superfamily)
MNVTQELRLPAWETVPAHAAGSLFFIGTATVLVSYGGFTFVTDPNFIHRHEKVDLGGGLSATRQTDPAMEIHQLPALDFVLLSHFHGDHFDQVAIRELAKDIPIITTPHAVDQLQKHGFTNLYPLDTWDTISISRNGSRLSITAAPGKHGPTVVDLVLPDVMGSLLEFHNADAGSSFRMYITGDTLVFDDIREIPRRFPSVDLALLHLGGTRIMGLLLTMDDEQGVEMLEIIQPDLAIPIHYNDYDVFKSPLEDFQRAVQEAGWAERVRYLRHGETYTIDEKR